MADNQTCAARAVEAMGVAILGEQCWAMFHHDNPDERAEFHRCAAAAYAPLLVRCRAKLFPTLNAAEDELLAALDAELAGGES